uniref:Uncharacterized protein n=1 Tax=Hucho hucho TaxID=62062 RepID=A0A4W5N188_9TELE
MQVSFACSDQDGGRGGLRPPGNGGHSKQNATSANTASQARARFRTVALIARSLGSFTNRYHHNLKESTAKLTGMKYRRLAVQTNLLQEVAVVGDEESVRAQNRPL